MKHNLVLIQDGNGNKNGVATCPVLVLMLPSAQQGPGCVATTEHSLAKFENPLAKYCSDALV